MADESKRKRTFSAPRLTFRVLAVSCPVLVATWFIVYLAPPAPLATWNGWRFLGLSRGQWHAVFLVSVMLAASTSLVRRYVDFRLRRKAGAKRATDRKKPWYEWAMVVAVLMIVSLELLREYTSLGDRIDAYWADVYPQTPRSDAERLTLRELADLLEVEPEPAADALRRDGFPVNNLDRTVAEIARMRYACPMDVYNAIRTISPRVNTPGGSLRKPQTSPAPLTARPATPSTPR